MHILILNGSPRMKGNTRTGLLAVSEAMKEKYLEAKVEFLDVTKHKLSGCTNCDGCKRNGGKCVMPDESAEIIEKLYKADYIVFGTPVYWWGMSAQLKMVIDKMYSKSEEFHKQRKNIGLLTVGAAELEDPQYRIIREQMKCICDFLGWDLSFSYSISAYEANELSGREDEINKLKEACTKK